MTGFFNVVLVQPLYNALIFLVGILPFSDIGLAVVILTLLVRFIIFPISRNAIKSQIKMKEIQKPLKDIQEKYKDDRQTMSLEMMKLYKDNNIKPFSSFLLILIQLPIIISLFFVFSRTNLPEINPDFLYSFISLPEQINPLMLGFFSLTSKSIVLAFLAAFTQFIQAQIMFKKNELLKKDDEEPKEGMMNDVMKGMQVQMKYVMPIFMYFLALSLGSLIAIYFVTGNIFSIFQEMYVKNKIIKDQQT
jgi:YidC/Oxa1 family membrane protein insertase